MKIDTNEIDAALRNVKLTREEICNSLISFSTHFDNEQVEVSDVINSMEARMYDNYDYSCTVFSPDGTTVEAYFDDGQLMDDEDFSLFIAKAFLCLDDNNNPVIRYSELQPDFDYYGPHVDVILVNHDELKNATTSEQLYEIMYNSFKDKKLGRVKREPMYFYRTSDKIVDEDGYEVDTTCFSQ